jgi:putative ABC transport system permease protein
LQVNGQSFQVIGVLSAEKESSFSNPNNQIYIPYTTAMTVFNTEAFSDIVATAISSDKVSALQTDITNTLLANHKITDKKLADFSVLTSADLLSTVGNITSMLTSLLAGIAAISLVVGGIGIMNIMLVSVTERTREIGLRKAVGAKTSDILWQFVIEAILLTVIGGILGIGLGYLIGKIASHFIGFNASITASSILLAVGVSTTIGLIFGIYPAAKAARLNPIDALRYE